MATLTAEPARAVPEMTGVRVLVNEKEVGDSMIVASSFTVNEMVSEIAVFPAESCSCA